MKRFLTACAVAVLALGVLGGCSQGNNSVQGNTGASIISLSPSVIVNGGPDFTLTVFGSRFNGFTSKTVVRWNGKTLVSTFVDVATVTAVVPASLIAKPGTAYVNVFAPQSGTGMNGLSNSLAFIVAGAPNPVPVLSSISPTSTAICTSKNCSNVTITLTGTNFLPTSTNGSSRVTFTGLATLGVQTAINTSSITATQIRAVIPGSYLTAADIAQIDVINPPSAPCILSSCPELGGGATNIPSANTPPITTQIFTIGGSGQAAAASASATTVAEETPAISQDGRYVAFSSAQDTVNQIMLRDTCVGVEKDCSPSSRIVSVAPDGTAGNADSHSAVISAEGRFVAFSSAATNLLEDAPKGRQIYIHDTCIGAPTGCKPSLALISTDPEGTLNGTESILPSISSSGRFVAFVAITPDPNAKTAAAESTSQTSTTPNSGLRQVFLRDTCFNAPDCTPKTTRISLQPGDSPATSGKPAGPALSGLAKQIALANQKNATVFTHTVPVDDSVFLALPTEPK
jgi:hypothetical protein